uniref:E3 ubiquitin ligase UBR4 C-terminal domain-containing protein n=1 Tax=Leptocylindrus danicus TaxID=163516 RepID=A0A7S2LBI9_9STRA
MRTCGIAADKICELEWWQSSTIQKQEDDSSQHELKISCAPAQHWCSRTPFDRNLRLWCSWAFHSTTLTPTSTSTSTLTAADRKRYYLTACVHILESQYPAIININMNNAAVVTGDATKMSSVCHQNQHVGMSIEKQKQKQKQMAMITLPLPSIQQLIHSMNITIRPPPKPLALKLFLRRAPSQEEFFRGSLSKNPILLSSLRHQHPQQNNRSSAITAAVDVSSSSASNIANNDNNEPLMSDLRQHIANDLQMGDSAELLELLVAGKIIDMGLKVRVVQQVLWRRHVLDNNGGGGSGNAGGSASSIANSMGLNMGMSLGMGMNLSMNISSGGGGGASGNNNDANDPNGGYSSDASVTSLPPMVVTYRLAGVDGEATEDVVSELVDGEEKEKMDEEKEFAITRIVAEAGTGRCFGILLRCIEDEVREVLKSIRRDEIMCKKCKSKTGGGGNKGKRRNPSKEAFLSSPACPALVLLKHCCKLKSNRKKMVEARAPTRMLRILLDILGTITSDDSGESGTRSSCGGQSTSDCLQGLIEILASDMSSITDDDDGGGGGDATTEDANMCAAEDAEDTSTVQVLLESLTESESTTLTAPLRKIIADLLPFLTYGQKSSSKALAEQFVAHIQFPRLAYTLNGGNSNIVMDTFVQTLLTLPPVVVCNELRAQLLSLGFTGSTAQFIMQDAPRLPPPWSPALNCSTIGAKRKRSKADTEALEEQWRAYYSREPGLLMALRMLIGLCTKHGSTQTALVNCDGFVQLCHWMESTSISAANDTSAAASSSSGETRNELGLVAETLLDALQEGNEYCKSKIKAARKATKDRKKELAEERRSRALVGMNIAALTSGGAAAFDKATESTSPSSNTVTTRRSAKVASADKSKEADSTAAAKPSWMAEMEAMEDEEGLTCAVCQEGRVFQPTELLGLYVFMKKVVIPQNKGGSKSCIDGTSLFLSLPMSMPRSLLGSIADEMLFRPAKAAVASVRRQSSSSSSSGSSSSRLSHFVTTVTGGNAIHYTCHARAKQADRNHPKAPKGEWEGAALRNSRVSCNSIFPLVSSLKNSEVPLVVFENSLANYQSSIANVVGARPKSMVWTVLHDARLLLLRIAYGEPLNADCGGGSLLSNTSLILQLLLMAEMFIKNSELEAQSAASVDHVRYLSAAFLSAMEIIGAEDYRVSSKSLMKNSTDASLMACMCCIIFNNMNVDSASESTEEKSFAKDLWKKYRNLFAHGIIRLAGRRKAQGVVNSGCISGRSGRSRSRANSLGEEDLDEGSGDISTSILGKRGQPTLESESGYLRPMLTLFVILDQLSTAFNPDQMDDEKLSSSAESIAAKIELCRATESIYDVCGIAKLNMSHEQILQKFEEGYNLV